MRLKIYDILGGETATLVGRDRITGRKQVIWNAADAASGVYIYGMTAESSPEGGSHPGLRFRAAKKLIVLKQG